MDDKEKQQEATINVWGIANIGCTMDNPTFQTLVVGSESQTTQEPDANTEEVQDDCTKENVDENLVAKLMPIFYNNEEDVREFLKKIRGMAQEDITDLVNRWVEEKRISDYGNSRKGELWNILHKAGLYTRSKANWNGRVK